eukprot:TRINITY_DN34756_c0_g1_i1.p1 TRINITY_DN34756_c0_g1~~TRINITY_DN34756_c0_g1_i1.p1  ORF type:complete len:113 (+),score=21.08 TRINITY_DN34756_c0_g1_i1:32-340(+)
MEFVCCVGRRSIIDKTALSSRPLGTLAFHERDGHDHWGKQGVSTSAKARSSAAEVTASSSSSQAVTGIGGSTAAAQRQAEPGKPGFAFLLDGAGAEAASSKD